MNCPQGTITRRVKLKGQRQVWHLWGEININDIKIFLYVQSWAGIKMNRELIDRGRLFVDCMASHLREDVMQVGSPQSTVLEPCSYLQ